MPASHRLRISIFATQNPPPGSSILSPQSLLLLLKAISLPSPKDVFQYNSFSVSVEGPEAFHSPTLGTVSCRRGLSSLSTPPSQLSSGQTRWLVSPIEASHYWDLEITAVYFNQLARFLLSLPARFNHPLVPYKKWTFRYDSKDHILQCQTLHDTRLSYASSLVQE